MMDESRAESQDIRPLEIAILNLMPLKEDTELDILRVLSNFPIQLEITFLTTATHRGTHVDTSHLNKFYQTFDDVKHKNFDGLIITGAPVEHLEFEEVTYWDELCQIFEWSKTHVYSTFHICWGAQAGLYYHYGIDKMALPAKMFGVFRHRVTHKGSILFRGFDDVFLAPHSRHTGIERAQVAAEPRLKILAESEEAGVYAISTHGGRQIFITGHSEYDADTLEQEYKRDLSAGKPIGIPQHYYPNDDIHLPPQVRWRAHANLLFCNWLNYFVYQSTPYDLAMIPAQTNA